MESGFFQQVYEIVQKIPVGSVATYGQIARLCGNPRASRAVGYARSSSFDEAFRREFGCSPAQWRQDAV